VVGGRYGSIDSQSAKSVTNLEYLAARAKGIPIYAFALRDLIALLPVWESNRNADYSRVVDAPQLFEFLSEIRAADGVWTFPFDTAQEIISVLRTQLGYLMSRGLDLVAQLRGKAGDLADLSPFALRIALERPPAWEPLLLAQILRDEVARHQDARRDLEEGIAFGAGEHITEEQISDWCSALSDEAQRITTGTTKLVNAAMNTALSESHVPSIAYSARRLAEGYREALAWSARIRRASVPHDWRPLFDAFAQYLRNFLDQIEEFGSKLQTAVEAELRKPESERQPVDFKFTITIFNEQAFSQELEKLRRKRGLE
jgi:predicted transcriptional regulator